MAPLRRARSWWPRVRRGLLGAAIAALVFLAVPVVVSDAPTSTVLLDAEGRLLSASVARDQQWRFPGTGVVPEKYAAAVTTFEDRRFWWHPGVDPLAVARAVRLNVSEGRVVSGASTLTMQVVRIARGNPPRTLPEKLLEAVLAVRLEVALSKAEILARYAESAPFGGNTVGIEAASWRYFGRPPAQLSWAEAATLAVLPNNPALVHPGRGRGQLQEKRDRVLRSLAERGHLDADELAASLAEPLPEAPHPVPQLVLPLLGQVRGERVQTTLDGALQERALEVMERHVAVLSGNGIHNAAAVIAELESGRVLAYVGNVRPRGGRAHGEHVDVVTAPRSTGSLLKPLLYASMLEAGELLPHQLVPDIPTRFAGFSPENFDHTYDGAVPAAEALARSRNVPAVWMLRDHTPERFARRLRDLGMTTLFRPAADYGLSLIVGGAEGRLWELVGLYRDLTLSSQGPTLPPALRWRGEPGPARPSPFDAGAAWLTLQALHEVNRPGSDAAWRSFAGAEHIAWKTGTSFGFRDGWAIGTSADRVIGVWVGNADGEGRPGLTGTMAAAPILFDLFDLEPTRGELRAPDDALVSVKVCEHSGMLAGPDCAETHLERVPAAGATGAACGHCTLVHCTAGCAERADSSCADVTTLTPTPWFRLPAAQEAYYARRHATYRPLPPVRDGCALAEASPPLAVLIPSQDATVLVPTELDGRRGRVVFQATHRERAAVLYWHLDDTFVATTTAPHELPLDPAPGAHRVTVVDPDGARVVRRFTAVASRE